MTGEEQIHGQNHTHLPLLILAVRQTGYGHCLELGCGNASTPNFHALLSPSESGMAEGEPQRNLYSFDSEQFWIDRFKPLGNDWHKFAAVPGWLGIENYFDAIASRYGVVLIDHSPSHQRIIDVLRLADRAEQIVIHDVEAEGYGFEQIRPRFKYVVEDRRYRPWTAAVSNVRPLVIDW